MIRLLLILFAALTAYAAAPGHAAPAAPGVAYDILEGLTTEVGQRLAGTEAEARARDWSVAKLKALGFSNVRSEAYTMPVWVRGAETAEIISPFPQKLIVTALGNSGSTGDAGIMAQVIGFETMAAFEAADPASVKGKIVFVSHAMKAAQDGSGYGPFGQARRAGPSIASQKGAAAIVVRSIGTDRSRSPHTGVQVWAAGAKPIPAGALSIVDAENLQRMLAREKPVVMKLVLTPRQIGTQPSGNVIAEVPGSDPAAGMVVIGGHLDSWDLGTGAIDDGAGVAIMAAAAKAIMDTGKQPRRTIRVVWWGSEEVGGFGADAYYAAHKDEPHALVAESDFGADRVWRFDAKLPESAAALGDRIATALMPMGIPRSKIAAGGGADTENFVAAGVAVIDLQQDGMRYFDLHHTPEDTLDKVDPAQLQQNVDAWAIVIGLAANAPEDLLVRPAAAPAIK